MSFIPKYIWVMVGLACVDWFAAILIEKIDSKNTARQKSVLIVAIAIQLTQLILFKYLGFFTTTLNSLASLFNVMLGWKEIYWLLPLGISFHTFQSISYLVDVYRKKERAEKNPAKLLFFLIFFPQLVAGPIERASHLLTQIRANGGTITHERIRSGVLMIFYGLFKKLVIADQAAAFVMSQACKPFWNKTWKRLKVDKKSKPFAYLQIFTTFHLVLLSWVFFRAQTLLDTEIVFRQMFSFHPINWSKFPASTPIHLIYLALSLVIIAIWREWRTNPPLQNRIRYHAQFAWACRAALVYYFILEARFETKEFIYFRF